jgi:S-DNA-T family DNA segregation ATPase FtsK/SpoIIIE
LTGQIKSNFGYRICGKADDILSNIIIDSTYASTMITEKDKGVFVTGSRSIFKGFLLNEDTIFNDYSKPN